MRSRDEQIAFWINAYNAHRAEDCRRSLSDSAAIDGYPARSIRQVPGAFERITHRVGRPELTLDQIEQTILAEFGDPRVFLALGRGAIGSGRLRSEAVRAAALERQLTEVADECATPRAVRRYRRVGEQGRASARFSRGGEKSSRPLTPIRLTSRVRQPQPDRARRSRLRLAPAADD